MSQALSQFESVGMGLNRWVHPKLMACTVAAVVSGTMAVPIGMRVAEYFTPAARPAAAPLHIEPSRPSSFDERTGVAPLVPPPAVSALPAGPPAAGQVPAAVPVETEVTAMPGPMAPIQSNSAPVLGATASGLVKAPATQLSRPHSTGIHANPHESVLALLQAMAHGKSYTSHVNRSMLNHGDIARSHARPAPPLAADAIMTEAEARFEQREPAAVSLGGPAHTALGLNGTGMRHRL